MIRHALFLAISILSLSQVESAKQQVQLSDSYLPVAMQVISYVTDQLSFATKQDATPKPASSRPTIKPTVKPTPKPTTRPQTSRPSSRPSSYWTTTPTPYVTSGWWSNIFTTKRNDVTTPFHKPGLYAPYTPPKPSDRFSWNPHRFILLPVNQNSQYTVVGPKETMTPGPLLSMHEETIRPLLEKRPESSPLLPPHNFVEVSGRSERYDDDELTEENLQYLSEDVRDMIKMAHDPNDSKVVSVFDGVKQGSQTASKNKLSATNLRLLLLYDLLSRDAKRQRLSDYSGFSPDVMKALVESSSGTARAQLKLAISKMVERKDCGNDYANNRAKELVVELGKDESPISNELRYMQPLIYEY